MTVQVRKPTHVINGPRPDYAGGECLTHSDPDLWDTDSSAARDHASAKAARIANLRVAEAKVICCRCPVIDVCLKAALTAEDGFSGRYRSGVRGGLDRYERAAMPSEGEREVVIVRAGGRQRGKWQ